jgi:hypothetical protein
MFLLQRLSCVIVVAVAFLARTSLSKREAIAAAMNGRGRLVATDVRDRRIDLLRRTVAASGAAV